MSGLPTPKQAIHMVFQTVDGGLQNLSYAADAVSHSLSPLPPITSDFNEAAPESLVSQGIELVRDQVKRGLPVVAPAPEVIAALINAGAASKGLTDGIDDRKKGLEYGLVALSRLPPDSAAANNLQHIAVRALYRDLPHPPGTLMGKAFRSSDGGGNSLIDPDLGRSGTTYSRSCTGTHSMPLNELPDPGLLFDALERRDKFVPHPGGLSGLFFNFATTVIHSVFRTSRTDANVNETSSYVDLGILYGNTQAHQDTIRDKSGMGKIWPDVFCETRLLSLPPGVCAILVVFNRNHNYIADMLLKINERGEWKSDISDTSKFSDDARKSQDDEIFQTARLINSAFYANVVLGDYLAGILGTVRDGSSWTLNIGGEHREADHSILERGAGNSCSVEFNVLYRLHPSMSEDDAAHTEGTFKYLFGRDVDFDTLSTDDFKAGVLRITARGLMSTQASGSTSSSGPTPANGTTSQGANGGSSKPKVTLPDLDAATFNDPLKFKAWVAKLSPDQLMELQDDNKPNPNLRAQNIQGAPGTWVKTNGKYDDAELAAALQRATSVPGGCFKARGVPGVMRVIELMGIEQARSWGCCTLNEFRRFLGLKPYATFEEWNPNPSVAEAARKLYRSTENLELYIGLVAEESKPVMEGAGLCPSYTMSRAILADAVALVRGDRHLTYDFTPFNLTSWGFTECNRNTGNAAWGGILGHMLSRALPNHYNNSSVFTHFPLMTPETMETVLTKLGQQKMYTYDAPVTKPTKPVTAITDQNAVTAALGPNSSAGSTGLRTTYGPNIQDIGLLPSFLSNIDSPAEYRRATAAIQAIFVPPSQLEKTALWFHDKTVELLREKSFTLVDKTKYSVDIVKDVLRLIPVHWASSQVAGLPLKTASEPRGIYYEQQMYQMLKEIYSFVYLQSDNSLKIPLRAEAKENVVRLNRFIKLSLREAAGGIPASLLGAVAHIFIGDGHHQVDTIAKRLLATGKPIEELANEILGVISTASVELSQIFAHVVNFYLPDPTEDKSTDPKIMTRVSLVAKFIAQAQSSAPGAAHGLEFFVREALRLDPAIPGVYREATSSSSVAPLSYTPGDRLLFDLAAAGRGPTFTKPDQVDITRSADLYASLQGDGVFKVLGEDFVYAVTAQVLRAVFSLHNIRRGLGPTGTLRRFKMDVDGTTPWAYLDTENSYRITSWATGLTVQYDD